MGYIKKVFRAKVNGDNKLNIDRYGHPDFRPNETAGILHQESGYFMAYRDKGYKPGEDYRIVKVINIPRGVTVNVDGVYKGGEHKMELDAEDSDRDYRIYTIGTAANREKGNDILMRNYE